MQTKLRKIERDLEIAKRNYEFVEAINDNLWKIIEDKDMKIAELENENSELQHENSELQHENSELKAEIERLNIRNKALTDITKNYDWKFAKAKSEARKEFAERLKKKANSRSYCTIWVSDVDNLLKEMEGEE